MSKPRFFEQDAAHGDGPAAVTPGSGALPPAAAQVGAWPSR
jgi:hypothetical protein